VLQFPPNTPVPDRTAPQILADFAAAVPSAYLALAVVWPRASSAAENDLSRARLQTVVDAVAPSFPQKAGFSLELPVAPPVGLEDPASVGGMLLVGFQPERVRTSIHHVFFMKSDKELQGRMKASLMAGDQRGFLAAMRGAHDVLIEFAAPDHPDPARWQEARGEHQNLLTNRQRIAESWSLVSRNAPDANTAREICDYVVAKLPAENALPLQTVALPDFGAKSMTATILFFESAADRDVPPIRSVAKAPRKRPPKRPG
jgi:hypothetical protein